MIEQYIYKKVGSLFWNELYMFGLVSDTCCNLCILITIFICIFCSCLLTRTSNSLFAEVSELWLGVTAPVRIMEGHVQEEWPISCSRVQKLLDQLLHVAYVPA
jgi:hypothetical protein